MSWFDSIAGGATEGLFGLASLGLGSWLGSEAAEDAAYRQKEFAKELANFGYDLNVKSLLETPANARKGLVDAGFNPILAVNSAAGSPMSTQIPQGVGSQQADVPQMRLDPLGAMAKAAMIDQTNAQTDLIEKRALGEGWQVRTLTASEARGLGANLLGKLGFHFNGSDSQTFLVAYNPITNEIRNLAHAANGSLTTSGEPTNALEVLDAPPGKVEVSEPQVVYPHHSTQAFPKGRKHN